MTTVGSLATCQTSVPKQSAAHAEQSAGTGELNTKEANRITLPPPKGVKAKQEGDTVVVEWTPSAQKRVVEYKVFRIDEKDGKITVIGQTKDAAFMVEKVEGKPEFAVAAVDYRGNEGAVSPPVKIQSSATK
jgi:hypothetical protein